MTTTDIFSPAAEAERANRKRVGEIMTGLKGIAAAAGDRPLTKAQAIDFETLQREAAALRAALGEPITVTDRSDMGELVKAVIAEHDAWSEADNQRRLNEGMRLSMASFGYGSQQASDVRVLRPDQKLAEYAGGAPMVGFDHYVKGLVTGDWRGIPDEYKAMSVGSDPSAGYLVPSPLSAALIDRARNQAVIFRAGALTVPMTSNTLTISRLAADPSAGWHQENAVIAASDPTLEAVTLRARTVVAVVKGSVELFEDAIDIENTLEKAITAALALEMDRAALRGTGASGEPLGVVNQAGVSVTGSIGAPTSYVAFADTPALTLRNANAAEPYSFISSPRTFNKLGVLVTGITSDLTRLAPPPDWNGFQKFPTNQIPVNLGGGTNETECYIGDFRQMIVGMRTNLTIEATRVAADSTSSAFSNLQVWIRAYLRMDVALAHPNHFAVLTGVL